MRILCDIGGTYARFGREHEGEIVDIAKYEAAAFPDLPAALRHYCEKHSFTYGGALRIATAAYPDTNGHWRFVNRNEWVIDPRTIDGWDVERIMNDFEAATYALIDLPDAHIKTLKSVANVNGENKCILGPGTGLGLGYLHGQRVQKTHGGHMPIGSLNDEHGAVIQKFRAQQTSAVVFENIISGSGFFKLKELYGEADALRLFHEFLGIFAANAVITGHAYGGVYLSGGTIERLIEAGQFDLTSFERGFIFDAVPSVKNALDNTPIIYITDPYPALRGLLNA